MERGAELTITSKIQLSIFYFLFKEFHHQKSYTMIHFPQDIFYITVCCL